jgi:HIRAN domain-containing protein
MDRRNFMSYIAVTLGLMPVATLARSIPDTTSRLTLLNTELAGFQYYAGEKLWVKISAGDKLSLLRESTNPYDKQAVALFWQDFKIGYVPRNDNTVISQLMDRKIPLASRIVELKQSSDPWQRIRFIIELVE